VEANVTIRVGPCSVLDNPENTTTCAFCLYFSLFWARVAGAIRATIWKLMRRFGVGLFYVSNNPENHRNVCILSIFCIVWARVAGAIRATIWKLMRQFGVGLFCVLSNAEKHNKLCIYSMFLHCLGNGPTPLHSHLHPDTMAHPRATSYARHMLYVF
jgi:hypothetical protein